jgi:hypothetical protein
MYITFTAATATLPTPHTHYQLQKLVFHLFLYKLPHPTPTVATLLFKQTPQQSSGASQDVFATGNVVTTSNGTVLSAATSAADATTLTVVIGTTADAQLFDLGSRLVFTCVKTGEWNVNHEVHLGPEATATAIEGTLAFT